MTGTFPIFANRQEQVGFALKSLSNMGVRDLGAIYATPQDFALQSKGVERTAKALQLRLQSFQAGADARDLGQRLTPGTPAILLFVGGTPELARFTQGLEKQSRQRYLVALADVNLQTLMQMGAARNTPVIATQPVPMVTASLPVVRAYRDVMGRLFDEPPSPLSLAGFLAARYTSEVLDEGRRPGDPRQCTGGLPATRRQGHRRLLHQFQPSAIRQQLRHPEHADHRWPRHWLK
jgi:hypothetical protein